MILYLNDVGVEFYRGCCDESTWFNYSLDVVGVEEFFYVFKFFQNVW